MPRAKGPFEVLEKVNDNAYKVDLPGEHEVLAAFNVADLSPFHLDDSQADLRIKSFQQREDNGVLPSQDQVHDQSSLERPRTRSQVQKMADLLLETETEPYEYKTFFKPGFVFLIT